MTDTKFYILMRQFLNGHGNEAGRKELQHMVQSGSHDEELKILFDEMYNRPVQGADLSDESIRHILEQVCTPEQQIAHNAPVRALPGPWHWAAAAALILVLGAAALWQWWPQPQQQLARTKAKINAIHPATDQATLTLADGRTIILDTAGNGLIAETDGARITGTPGQLQYNSTGNATATTGANILTVPRGGKFKLLLPDGSTVWLNSATALKYPAVFTNGRREVELDGEAFFDIKPGTAPFIVKTKQMDVQVLGTSFNVMAYKDEPAVAATLVAGKVAVTTQQSRLLLQPEEQASVSGNSTGISKSLPDLNEVLAWKNGEFRFNQKQLPYILRQVARWYDVAIEYRGAMPTENFDGVVSRKSNVADLLEILEETRAIHFKIEDRKIIVIPGAR